MLAQYHELLDFAQFGTELDELSQRRLARGARVVEILKQPQYLTYTFVDQSIILFALKENYLDRLEIAQVQPFIMQLVSYVKSVYPQIYETITLEQDITADVYAQLQEIVAEFSKLFIAPEKVL